MTLTLSVVGCGYLGATHAACMSSLGFTVVGVDTDPEKVALLQSGKLPFYEPGLDTLLEQEMKTGRLSFTTDFSAVKDADVHFVCVGTPQSKDGLAADLTYVKSAVAAIAPHLKEGSLVVNSSQGGGTKDTWVLQDKACEHASSPIDHEAGVMTC